MRYTVVYHGRAEDELAHFWSIPSIRQAVADAAFQIDRILRDAPLDAGESRAAGRRILLVPPLDVKFDVSEDDRIVRVLQVWHYEKRPRRTYAIRESPCVYEAAQGGRRATAGSMASPC